MKKIFEIKTGAFIPAGCASLEVRKILKRMGFHTPQVMRVSICAYEAEMNIVMHGGDGELMLMVDEKHIIIDVKDDGPGIENIETALQEGYSTATPEHRSMGFGAGMGLPNIKKNADIFEIYSQKGCGVHLRIVFNADKENV